MKKTIKERISEKKEHFTNELDNIRRQIDDLYNEIQKCADNFHEENDNNINEKEQIADYELMLLIDGFYGALNDIEKCQDNINSAMFELDDSLNEDDFYDSDDWEEGDC